VRLTSRRGFVVATIGAVSAALAEAGAGHEARAAGPSPEPASEELARGYMPYSDLVGGPAEVITRRTTLPPGTALPWHAHPGPLFGSVTAGTLTIERSLSGCRSRYDTGAGFIFAADDTHRDRNESTVPAEFVGTYVAPAGSALRVPAEPPSAPDCP
jgi:quercetin dioxygenase-like cupin family protein